jgi:hypothetical protein
LATSPALDLLEALGSHPFQGAFDHAFLGLQMAVHESVIYSCRLGNSANGHL